MKADKGNWTGAVLIDLSKALEGIDHKLLIVKFNVYGVGKSSIDLMCSYIMRKLIIKSNS